MFGDRKIVYLTQERRMILLRHLQSALIGKPGHKPLDERMRVYAPEMKKYSWVASSSCCDGHEPHYSGYICLHVTEEQSGLLERMLVALCDNFTRVYVQKTVEYKDGVARARYLLRMPSEWIDKVMPELFTQLDVIDDTRSQSA